VIAGWISYNGNGSVTEIVKLAYAYLALMSVVCAMIMLTMKQATPQRVPAPQQEVQPTGPSE
jgi:hypothetical protein